MSPFKPDYTSFLLRLWREPPPVTAGHAASNAWLVEIEHIPSGEKRYFASLEDCFAYIRAQAGGSTEPGARDGGEA